MNHSPGALTPSLSVADVVRDLHDVGATLGEIGSGWEGAAGAACAEQATLLAGRARALADVADELAVRIRGLEIA